MSSFKALRELAQQKTAAQNQQVQAKLEERKRKEEAEKKAQEERDRRERELEARMRAKKLEDTRRAEELARKMAQNAARRAEREEQLQLQRETKLLQRVSRARSPTEPGAVGTRSRKRSRSGSPDGGGTSTLTREEKRARKAQNELRKAEQEQAARARKHIPNFGGYGGRVGNGGASSSATGKRLAGGALDIIDDGSSTPKTVAAVGSTRDRIISAMPMQLTKLNTVKRDTRTIDDVQRERQQRVLEGDDARNFGDWFGGPTRAQREAERKKKADEDQAKREKAFALKRQQDAQRSGFSEPTGAISVVPPPSAFQPQPRARPAPVASSSRLPPKKQPPPTKSSTSKSKAAAPSSSNANAKAPSKYAVSSSKPAAKRRRELDEEHLDDSEDESDYGRSTARRSILPEDLLNALRGGRSRPVYEEVSDEGSDMEAGLDDVFEEEQRSIAIAKREDQLALREQMKHEAEKRRRLGIRS